MKNIIILFVLAMALFSTVSTTYAGWLIYHKPAYRGKVIDAETKKPIEGAVVVAVYKKQTLISGPGGGSSTIIKIRENLTDKKGEFYFPSYQTIIQPLSKEDNVNFVIFKAGYGSHPGRMIYPFELAGPEYLFSKELETKGEIHGVPITFGVVELPKLNTWEERWKANMISISDIPERKWPLLYDAIKKEEEWLDHNKGWRRKLK